MKALILLVLIAVIVLISWQRREIAHLSIRETELLENIPATPGSSAAPASTPALSSPRAASERMDRTASDISGYIAKYMDFVARFKNGEITYEGDTFFLWEDLSGASAGDLKTLAVEFENNALLKEFRRDMLSLIACLLTNSDPKAAVELSRKGGDGDTFLNALRAWSSRDPKAAAAWLDRALDEDSSPGASHPNHMRGSGFEAVSLATRISADPAGEELDRLLQLDDKPFEAALREIVSVLPASDLPLVLGRVARHGTTDEEKRLDLIASILARHMNPADARDALSAAGLPPGSFAKTASTMIGHLDPISMRAGADWFLRSASGEERTAGLRSIVAAWAGHDRQSAAEWAGSLPDPEDRSAALEAIGPPP